MVPRAAAVNASLQSQVGTDKVQFETGRRELEALSGMMKEAKTKKGPQAQQEIAALQQRGQQLQQALRQLRQRLGRGLHLLDLGLGDSLGLVNDCTTTPPLSENVVRGGTPTYVHKSYSFTVCPWEYVTQRWEHRQEWEFKTCMAENGENNLTSPGRLESNVPYCEQKAKQRLIPEGASQQLSYCRGLKDAKQAQSCLVHMNQAVSASQEQGLRTFLGLYNQTASVPDKLWVFDDSQGEPCSNGEQRRVQVNLVCGAEGSPRPTPLSPTDAVSVGKGPDAVSVGKADSERFEAGHLSPTLSTGRLVRVAENGMCAYEMTLETPAVCSAQPPPARQTPPSPGGGIKGIVMDFFIGILEGSRSCLSSIFAPQAPTPTPTTKQEV